MTSEEVIEAFLKQVHSKNFIYGCEIVCEGCPEKIQT